MKITKTMIALLMFSFVITSCKKDDDVEATLPPQISGLEIGTNNSKIAYQGNDVHVEAEVSATANLASVTLEIHPEGAAAGWEFKEVYTEGIVGLKNAAFHQHLDVPADAPLGTYHVHLVVTDQQGRTTEMESDLEIKFDPTLPSATGFEVGLNTAGNDLHVEATVNAVNKLAKVVVEVHGGTFEKEFEFTDAAMVGQTTYNLHKHLDVTDAPAGHYHVHLKVVDQAGKEIEVEEHFDKL